MRLKDKVIPVTASGRENTNTLDGENVYAAMLPSRKPLLPFLLCFQSLTYKTEFRSYNRKQSPVLMIMTGNASETLQCF